MNAEVGQDLCADAVFAKFGGEAEFFVGFHRIEPLLLEFVGVNFCRKSDAAPFLAHVDEDAAPGLFDLLQRALKLGAAIAPQGAKDVAGEAFAVDADERGFFRVDVAFHQRKMVRVVHDRAVHVQIEIAVIGRELDDLFALDEPLVFAAVGDEILDGCDFEPVLFLESHQLGHAGHRSIVVHDFADDPGGLQPCELGEIDGGFGVARALENASFFGLEREDVPRLDESLRGGLRIDQNADRRGAVCGADAGGDPRCGIDGDGEGGFLALAVFQHHALEAELLGAVVGDRRADEAARVHHHEIDGFRGDFLGGQNEIALVFAARIVGDNDHLALANVRDDFFNCIKRRLHRTIILNAERRGLPEKKMIEGERG